MRHTIIVTGGAGFIGSHVADALVARGHEVHVVDDLSTGDRRFVPKKAKLHVMDIRSPKLKLLMKRVRPTRVAHLAAHIDLRRSVDSPSSDADINIMGTLNLLEACFEAKVPHIAFASTAAVYGGAKTYPTPETDVTEPRSPYGISKLCCEKYLAFAEELKGMRTASLRFANVYGPRQRVKGEAGVVAIFANMLLDGTTPVINGSGRQTRDFVYVKDVAEAVAAAVEQGASGTFNVSTGKETTVNALFKEIADALGIDRKPKKGLAKPGDEKRVALSPRRAAAKLKWKARTTVPEGVRETVAWIVEWRAATKARSRR